MSNYYTDYINTHKNEYPGTHALIKESSYTDEDRIVNYVTETMAGKPWADIQDVLIGVGMELDEMSRRGLVIEADSVINDLKQHKFL